MTQLICKNGSMSANRVIVRKRLELVKGFTIVAMSTVKSASWQEAGLLPDQLTFGERTAAVGGYCCKSRKLHQSEFLVKP